MDAFKLGMRDGGFFDDAQVGAPCEESQIRYEFGHMTGERRHIFGLEYGFAANIHNVAFALARLPCERFAFHDGGVVGAYRLLGNGASGRLKY